MASVISGIKNVEKRLNRLNMAAQAVLFNLLIISNRLGNSGWLTISDRELRELTRAKSNETITRAKRELQAEGLIDYRSTVGNSRCATRYELKFYTGSAPVNAPVESVQVSVQNEEFLLTRARKTTPPPSPPPQDLDVLTFDNLTNEREAKLDELIDDWRDDPDMPRLYVEQESKLRELVRSGKAKVEHLAQAITLAKERNSPDSYGHRGINFNFVMSQLERVLNPQKSKVKKSSVERRGDKYPPKKEVRKSWHPTLTTSRNVEVPTLSKGVEVETLSKSVEVETLPKSVEVPTLSKGVEVETLPKSVEVETLPKSVEVPTLTKGVEVPTLTKGVEVETLTEEKLDNSQ